MNCTPRARAGYSKHITSLVFGVLLTANFMTTVSLAKDKQTPAQHDEQLSKADSLLANGECKKVWSIFWPRFVKHDIVALREFSKLSSKYYFQLPGQSLDALSVLRKNFIFSIYGFNPEDPNTSKFTFDLLDNLEPIFPGNTYELRRCLADAKTTVDVTICQTDAQASHMVPSYSDFLFELKRDRNSRGMFVCTFLGDKFIPGRKQ